MLILAGVSINAIVGDNGVLTKAQKATIENKKASILEAIDLELASYNIDTILNNSEETSAMLEGLMNKGVIDTVLSSSGQTANASQALAIPQFDDSNKYTGYIDYGVVKDNYSILLSVDGSGIYKASFGEINVSSGGSVAAGTTVVTGDAFNSGSGTENPEDKGKFTIDNDASVMFVDEIGKNGEELSIYVKSGVHAKVNIFKDMILTNEGIKRSAIEIEPEGILDLYVAEGATLTVNSGFADAGADQDAAGNTAAPGGLGAYAGIRVPEVNGKIATLNLYGEGTIISTGGSAGAGGGTQNGSRGGGGGGGAGAGIGGNGGVGGKGNAYACVGRLTPYDSGQNGEAGENCGNINIYNSVKVYAYGGTGGSGGLSKSSAGGGGGGYPAAGIGGGGAGGGGGDHISGGGGYTGGNQEYVQESRSYNGMAGQYSDSTPTNAGGAGSGYFEKANDMWSGREIAGPIGGGGMYTKKESWSYSCSGDGGVAGKGGNIKISSTASIEAHNGNKYTDGSSNKEDCLIYIQDGKLLNISTSLGFWDDSKNQYYSNLFQTSINYTTTWGSANDHVAELRAESTIEKLNYSKNGTKYYVGQGIGSGAGYVELSNGTYTVDESMN